MSDLDLLSREDVLSGLPAKRAASLYFLIESRTAKLVSQSRNAMSRFVTDEVVEQRNLEYLEAYATGKDPPHKPTIQDLERYSTQWGELIPDNPRIQAAIVHILAQKFTFTYAAIPGIRGALGLNDEQVARAFHALYGTALVSVYAAQTSAFERLRWLWNSSSRRLETLPPFWTAYALTVTETVGMSILAVPIAIAHVGPLAGIAIILILGLVNILTVAAMAEAVVRSGQARYGNAYFGRVIHEYLGRIGGLAISIVMYIWGLIALLACYIGIGSVMADFTPIPVYVWIAIVFAADLYFVRDLAHDSLNSSVAFALVVGAVNLAVILLLSLVAFSKFNLTNFLYLDVPFVTSPGFDPALVELIFGVVLLAYLGHTAAGTCGKPVLNRDPSGRSLILGSAAGLATVMLLYCVWVAAVNGAIDFDRLAHESGTVLHPLAETLGPVARILGVVFAAMGMGMLSVHASLGIFSLVDERLPRRSRPVLLLPRRRARLVMSSDEDSEQGAVFNLTYLGIESGQPVFRWDVKFGKDVFHLETPFVQRYDTRMLRERISRLRHVGVQFLIEIIDATSESVRLRVITTMDIEIEGEWDAMGLSMVDLLDLPEREARTVSWLMRESSASLAGVAMFNKISEASASAMMNALVEKGVVRSLHNERGTLYRAQLTPRRGSQLPEKVWSAIEQISGTEGKASENEENRVDHYFSELVLDERVRVILTRGSHVAVFLAACWLFWVKQDSFVGVLSFGGEICATLAAGIFPVLVLYGARRKGEFVPGLVFRVLGHPLFVAGVYLLFITALLAYTVLIWTDPLERAMGGITIIGTLAMTYGLIRRREFGTRAVIELHEDLGAEKPHDPSAFAKRKSLYSVARFSVVSNGRQATADVRLTYPTEEKMLTSSGGIITAFDTLRRISFDVPALPADELKIRAHRLTFDNDSEPLPARVRLEYDSESLSYDLELTRGQIIVPIRGKSCRVEINLYEHPAASSSGTPGI